ncbi:uncharacterized protein LOC128677183 [Plodia interpunctella]|uniref:uncharacterized protein LOC128677183 n=1 Tax=Plodia interpunctella TaxID=58824 RepID=UPI0023689662|nr:uncharacterized protein LOC128677183 [Plodia interpunctella]
MVKLPNPVEQQGRAMGERGSARWMSRSHRRFGTRYGRRREEMKNREPVTLKELEELTERSVELMEKYRPKADCNFDIAMDLLRSQYNLSFMILCEKCGTPHANDEMSAPER